MDARLHALNRFGLGARVGEARQVDDPRGWLLDQLDGGTPLVDAPAISTSASDAVGAYSRAEDRATRLQARERLGEIAAAEASAALTQRVTTSRPFVERLVAFWSNHLCVSTAGKWLVAPLAGSYEREVIRPHVLGRFEEMVLASATHPAMLLYLDNYQSIGPNSRAALRGGRRVAGGPGLNENYARELLELHTLGVNGGYTQADVLGLARILTGWSIRGLTDGGALGFVFDPRRHEPGAHVVLGKRYEDEGVEQGRRAIRDFCRHPSTANFIATKLVKHFVGDEPPQIAVESIATVFRRTNGDLREVAASLVALPEAWREDSRKFRMPQDWLVSVLRASGAEATGARMMPALHQLRQPLWAPQSPKGFGDTTPEWADPDSLMNRAELARTLARGWTSQDAAALLEVIDVPEDDPLRKVVMDREIPLTDRVALVIAGPMFQWR